MLLSVNLQAKVRLLKKRFVKQVFCQRTGRSEMCSDRSAYVEEDVDLTGSGFGAWPSVAGFGGAFPRSGRTLKDTSHQVSEKTYDEVD